MLYKVCTSQDIDMYRGRSVERDKLVEQLRLHGRFWVSADLSILAKDLLIEQSDWPDARSVDP